ncbi:hypothetical protein ACHHYP_16284 [Achlya hypogyna]|uniref:PIH1 domain-containing protein 1 n=1 Tax=Achlya hypogyna TaxID=1202772 RepID=A0A1V9ZE64_ACHHY|nr:hypothetical protein ACHHYP_16284 [Achlya hypogyna]
MAGEDRNLEAAFAAAAAEKKFDMSEEEQKSFVKAMKDPQFRSLLNDYMLEISDPANRAEQELYLRQLENENKVPSDKQLVIPKPGFVLKTKLAGRKLFVNVCSSDKLQPPSSSKVAPSPATAAGTSWNLPYCVGPQRIEHDKGVVTFDVCYHPQTLTQGRESAAFLKMLVNTALDGVDLALSNTNPNDGKVSRDYHILKGVYYKSGNPITMCISTPKQAPASSTKSSASPKPEPAPAPKAATASAQTTSASTKSNMTYGVHLMRVPGIAYQIVQRGQFDMADHLENGEKKLFRPRELVVKLELPTHSSAKNIDLDVSSTQIKVLTQNHAPLTLNLPFPVIEAKGTAKFDKATKKLIVTLPVVPAEPSRALHVEPTTVNDKEEVSPVESVEEKPAAQAASHVDLTTEATATKVSPKPPPSDEFAPLREFALMATHDKPRIVYVTPKVTVTDTPSHISHIVHVPHITVNSIAIGEVASSIRIQFSADDGRWYEVDVPTTGVRDWTYDVATTNMAVICTKEGSDAGPTEPPYRMQDCNTTISVIVDVSHVQPSSIRTKFTATTMEVEFAIADKSYRLFKCLDRRLRPDECRVATIADDNVLVELQCVEDGTEQPSEIVEMASDAKQAIVARFSNDVMYELD